LARDDFPRPTRDVLRGQVGGRCSSPGCRAPTEGPSEASQAAINSVGVAAHITAASSGGPRYDPTLTPEQRSSAENGIWLCGTHADEIDGDVVRFPVPTLQWWKEQAVAAALQERGVPMHPRGGSPLLRGQFADVNVAGEINRKIGSTLERACLSEVFGPATGSAIRDLVIEVAKNSFQHGGATRVTLSVEPRRILLVDDGRSFEPANLLRLPGRGGRSAYEAVRDDQQVIALADYTFSRNQLLIVPVAHVKGQILPCTTDVRRPFQQLVWRPEIYENCERIYIGAPEFLSPSDAFELGPMIRELQHGAGKEIVLISEDLSATTLSILQGLAPGLSFLKRP
jgi:hypothetical protein